MSRYDELSLCWPFFSESMLAVNKDFLFVKVSHDLGHNNVQQMEVIDIYDDDDQSKEQAALLSGPSSSSVLDSQFEVQKTARLIYKDYKYKCA